MMSLLQVSLLASCVLALLVADCSGHHNLQNNPPSQTWSKVEVENNNIWGAMMSHLNYKLNLKNKLSSSFQSISRLLKMSKKKPHKPWPMKPMKPLPMKPMKPWPMKPMKPWPMKPWTPVTHPSPTPAPTTLPPPTTTTTTTAAPSTTTTTAPPPIDIDIDIDLPSPIEDVDIGVGSGAIFRPDSLRSAPASSYQPQIYSIPQLPAYQPFNFLPSYYTLNTITP